MDGFITDSDIDLIKRLSKPNVSTIVFNNTFKPYESHKIIVKPYWHTGSSGPSNVINDINKVLTDGKRIMVSVSSANLANEIINNLPPNKSYKLYTGEDYKIDDTNNQSMRQLKKHDFKDVVNSWASVDIVVHTSTL